MPQDVNQTPEEVARDRIDGRLRAAGWHVQDKDALDFNAGLGVAVREYQTDIGPADYVLFVAWTAAGHPKGRSEAEEPHSGLTRRRPRDTPRRFTPIGGRGPSNNVITAPSIIVNTLTWHA